MSLTLICTTAPMPGSVTRRSLISSRFVESTTTSYTRKDLISGMARAFSAGVKRKPGSVGPASLPSRLRRNCDEVLILMTSTSYSRRWWQTKDLRDSYIRPEQSHLCRDFALVVRPDLLVSLYTLLSSKPGRNVCYKHRSQATLMPWPSVEAIQSKRDATKDYGETKGINMANKNSNYIGELATGDGLAAALAAAGSWAGVSRQRDVPASTLKSCAKRLGVRVEANRSGHRTNGQESSRISPAMDLLETHFEAMEEFFGNSGFYALPVYMAMQNCLRDLGLHLDQTTMAELGWKAAALARDEHNRLTGEVWQVWSELAA